MNWQVRIQQRSRGDGWFREQEWCQVFDLERAIARLPRRLQPVAWMVSEHWTEREMATAMGLSPATAHRLKIHVLKLLAKNLSEREAKA